MEHLTNSTINVNEAPYITDRRATRVLSAEEVMYGGTPDDVFSTTFVEEDKEANNTKINEESITPDEVNELLHDLELDESEDDTEVEDCDSGDEDNNDKTKKKPINSHSKKATRTKAQTNKLDKDEAIPSAIDVDEKSKLEKRKNKKQLTKNDYEAKSDPHFPKAVSHIEEESTSKRGKNKKKLFPKEELEVEEEFHSENTETHLQGEKKSKILRNKKQEPLGELEVKNGSVSPKSEEDSKSKKTKRGKKGNMVTVGELSDEEAFVQDKPINSNKASKKKQNNVKKIESKQPKRNPEEHSETVKASVSKKNNKKETEAKEVNSIADTKIPKSVKTGKQKNTDTVLTSGNNNSESKTKENVSNEESANVRPKRNIKKAMYTESSESKPKKKVVAKTEKSTEISAGKTAPNGKSIAGPQHKRGKNQTEEKENKEISEPEIVTKRATRKNAKK